jgi:hypothetical protein
VAVKAERWRRRDRWRRSPTRLRSSVDAIPLDRPVFVLGMQGGGTTLIARSLLRHPSVVSISGNSSYWVATDEMGVVRNRMRRLPRALWGSAHRSDLEHPSFGAEHASVFAGDELYPAYRNTADDATPADAERLQRFIREHIAVYARDPQDARFVDKTHTYTVKIPYVDRLLEGHDPLFLLVLRNPYTMCHRAVRRKPPSWRGLSDEERLRVVAEHWANSNRLALQDGPRTRRFLAVRFEDFVRDPERIVRAVCAFAGLDYDDALVPRAGQTFPFPTLPSDRKWYPLVADEWRGRVSAPEAELVDSVCGPLAADLGYSRYRDTAARHPAVLGSRVEETVLSRPMRAAMR